MRFHPAEIAEEVGAAAAPRGAVGVAGPGDGDLLGRASEVEGRSPAQRLGVRAGGDDERQERGEASGHVTVSP
jgi:hypothetical protein